MVAALDETVGVERADLEAIADEVLALWDRMPHCSGLTGRLSVPVQSDVNHCGGPYSVPGVPGGGGLGITQLHGTQVLYAIHAHCCSGVRFGMPIAGAGAGAGGGGGSGSSAWAAAASGPLMAAASAKAASSRIIIKSHSVWAVRGDCVTLKLSRLRGRER
jgi:hypothetical protein